MTRKYSNTTENSTGASGSEMSIETVLRIVGMAVIAIQAALLFVMFYLLPTLLF